MKEESWESDPRKFMPRPGAERTSSGLRRVTLPLPRPERQMRYGHRSRQGPFGKGHYVVLGLNTGSKGKF